MAKPELWAMFPIIPTEDSLKGTGWVADGGTYSQSARSPLALPFQLLALYSCVRAKLASSDLLNVLNVRHDLSPEIKISSVQKPGLLCSYFSTPDGP